MRIGFASFEISPTTRGGAGVFLGNIAHKILERGHSLVLLLSMPQGEYERWCQTDALALPNSQNIENYLLSDLCSDIDLGPENFPSESYYLSYCWAWALRKVVSETQIDYFEFFDYCGPAYFSLIQRLLHPEEFPPRIGVRLHGPIEVIDRRAGSVFAAHRVFDYALERASLRLADVVLAPGSGYYKDEIEPVYGPHFRDRVRIIPPPVRLIPPVSRTPKSRDIVFVGRLSKLKGVDSFLHAAVAILSNSEWAGLAGDFIVIGAEEAVSTSQAERDILQIGHEWIGRRIHLIGHVSQSEMRDHFANAVCAVFPHRVESYCYAAHEAFLSGVPLILSDTPAFRDHFKEGVDALFFDGTVISLVNEIVALLRDRELGDRLAGRRDTLLPRYSEDHYPSLIRPIPPFSTSDDGPDACIEKLQIIVLHREKKPSASAERLLKDLRKRLPQQVGWLDLHTTETGSSIQLFGRFLEAIGQDGQKVIVQNQVLRPFLVFVDAERPPLLSFLVAAAAMLTRNGDIGCVVPTAERMDGTTRVGQASAALESCYLPEIKHLGAVVRIGSSKTLVEIGNDSGPTTEVDLMLRIRESGRIIVDWPLPSFAVHSPAPLVFGSGHIGLRRQAWCSNPLVLASFLTALGGHEMPFRALTVEDRISQQVDDLLRESLAYPRCVYILANQPTNSQANHTVTVLRLLSIEQAAALPWTSCSFEGEWEVIPSETECNSHWRTRCGRCAIDLSDVQQFDVMSGPEEGTLLMLHNGRAVALNLFAPIPKAVRVSIEILFDVAGGTIFDAQCFVDESGGIARLPTESQRRITIALDHGSETVARALKLPGEPPIMELSGPAAKHSASRIEHVRRLVNAIGATEVMLIGGMAERFAAALLPECRDLKIGIVLPRGISWHANEFSRIVSTVLLQKRHPKRLQLFCTDGALTPLVRGLGGTAIDVALGFPAFAQQRPKEDGQVTLLLSPGSGEIPAHGHIAAAAAMAAQLAPTAIDTIVYETSCPDIEPVLETFHTPAKIITTRSLDYYMRRLSGGRFILVAPYPTGIIDELAIAALANGGLVLTSTGALPLAGTGLEPWLTVGYWEQSDLLADKIVCLVESYQEVRRLVAGSSAAAETGVKGHLVSN